MYNMQCHEVAANFLMNNMHIRVVLSSRCFSITFITPPPPPANTSCAYHVSAPASQDSSCPATLQTVCKMVFDHTPHTEQQITHLSGMRNTLTHRNHDSVSHSCTTCSNKTANFQAQQLQKPPVNADPGRSLHNCDASG